MISAFSKIFMSKKRVWLISEVFYPDIDIATANIATQIALKFKEEFEVHVICGPQGYETKTTTKKNLEDITIHRWNYFNYDKNHKLKRLFRVIGISLGMFFYGCKIKKNDIAFVISNPAFITPLYAFLKRIKGFRFIMLMHDVFPENLVAGDYIKKENILYKLTQYFWSRSRKVADKIIVIGRDMKNLLLEKFPQNRISDIVNIPNWADTDKIFPITESQSVLPASIEKDKIIILFAGNHGVLQNLISFIKIIQQTKNCLLHFVFAGGGATKKELEQYVLQNEIPHITFLPPFPQKDNNAILNSCDIGLVSLTDKLYGVGVPSKSYNILAAEKPILFLGNTKTEIGQFVQENDIGWAFQYADSQKIIDFLNGLTLLDIELFKTMGKRGREIILQKFSKTVVLEQLCNCLH